MKKKVLVVIQWKEEFEDTKGVKIYKPPVYAICPFLEVSDKNICFHDKNDHWSLFIPVIYK
jgi:hypothetical protein